MPRKVIFDKPRKFSSERKYASIPPRGHTTTNLTGPKKGTEPQGIDTEVKGGSKKSSYRRR